MCIDVSDTESLSDIGDGYGGDHDDDIVSIYSESEGDSDDGDEDVFESASSQFGSDAVTLLMRKVTEHGLSWHLCTLHPCTCVIQFLALGFYELAV